MMGSYYEIRAYHGGKLDFRITNVQGVVVEDIRSRPGQRLIADLLETDLLLHLSRQIHSW